ncbi:class I SAM-dependent methyltransferase [Nanoarchaeota archaeon]
MTEQEWIKIGSEWKTTGSKRDVILPALENSMGDIHGKDVLDAGCGDGFFTRWLRSRGAHAIGIDLSSDSISKDCENDPEGEYHVMDVKKITLGDKFDWVLSLYVLLSFNSREDVKKAIKSMGDRLKPDGRLIIATTHPAFDDYNANMCSLTRSYPEKYRYTKSGTPMTFKSKDGRLEFTDYHWMIEDYVNCIMQAGLLVEKILEPLPVPESKEKDPELYEARMEKPTGILFVCVPNLSR